MNFKIKRPNWLEEIKVLVWDLDGTLYKEIPQMKKEIHKNAVNLVKKAQAVSSKKAAEMFSKTYQQTKSNSLALVKLGVNREEVLKGDWYNLAQLKYLQSDSHLPLLFKKLKGLIHIIDTNSNRQAAFKKLKILGLSPKIFAKIFTSTDMQTRVKPDPFAFKIVLRFTGLKAYQHLFIGDSEGKEVIPAKKLGFHTCFVWGRSREADISLPTVYELARLFK